MGFNYDVHADLKMYTINVSTAQMILFMKKDGEMKEGRISGTSNLSNEVVIELNDGTNMRGIITFGHEGTMFFTATFQYQFWTILAIVPGTV